MLSANDLVEARDKPPPELPSFGVKDFEPDGSFEQSSQIEKSLSDIKDVISYQRIKMIGSLSQAIWQPELQLAEVIQKSGSHWTTMGHTINQKLYIFPEEALYLLEIGALEITYNEVSLSVQRAYFVLLGQQNVTIEKYRVYSHLNANGYKVLRHSPKNSVTKYEKQLKVHKLGIKSKDYGANFSGEKRQIESSEESSESSKKIKSLEEISLPIITESCDVKEICKKMQIFQPLVDNAKTSLDFDYDIYTESSGGHVFKKSCLQLPNYRVIVHRSEDPMPDLSEICRLTRKFNDEVPVINAVVFPDYIAFYEINPLVLPDAFD